ncbi:MAG: kelch repeat-containing protein [Anaerolineales bacterium]
MNKRTTMLGYSLMLILLLTSACTPAQPEAMTSPPTQTIAPSTVTSVPATATTVPTATPVPTATATITPTEIPALNPSARGDVSMAYDSESDKIILFGGHTGGDYDDPAHYNGETWAYDVATNTWTEMKPIPGPKARSHHGSAYDSESDRVILFSGGDHRDLSLPDTWAYDYNTNTWTEMAKGPANRYGFRMAYDSESDRIILFSGHRFPNEFLNDTWAYDFNSDTWTQMQPSTSPKGRAFHGMTYDAQIDRVIVFGGDVNYAPRSDTWTYDFNTDTWEEVKLDMGTPPRGRFDLAMVYDAGADQTILYGGHTGGSETWVFDYSLRTWTQLEPDQAPGTRSLHSLVYSSAAEQVILFGGQLFTQFDYTDQTWSFDLNSNTWTNLTRSP